MFRIIAALILALLLAVMAYGIFWLLCLTYTTAQMRNSVKEALGAELTQGTAQWVPDPTHVTMDLPSAKLTLRDGPVREVRAGNLRLVSDFLMRDRWRIELPTRVEVLMANGKTLLLETEKGEVIWLREGNQLTLRAASVHLLDLNGSEIAKIGDVMMERKASDAGIRVNLASRPQWNGGQGVLSGEMVLPADVFANVVNLLGNGVMPSMGQIFGTIVGTMQKNSGSTLDLEGISFKMPGDNGTRGAVFGKVQVLANGQLTGTLVATSDPKTRVLDWVQRSALMQPRNNLENLGVNRFMRGITSVPGTVRVENMQSTLMLNGQPVGPLPDAQQVVAKLWPQS